jgi:hypothetical protein
MSEPEKLIPVHGGYRKLKSFQVGQLSTERSRITDSIVEDAARDWLGGLGYDVLSGPAIARGETPAERSDNKQVFLFNRLQARLVSGELLLSATAKPTGSST